MSVHLEPTTLLDKQIGSYRLTRSLGHGGAGHVFLGTHVQSGHEVAMKIVQRPTTDSSLRQLWNEARILPRLRHSHVVRMLDFKNRGALSVLILEFAHHGSMRHRYSQGTPLILPAVAHYVQQVSSALHYTHSLGYIHRDVKPENLLLTRDDHLLLSDFGIATTPYYASLTHDRFGTALYTAPEQAVGFPCFASDQYSLAIVTYEWLCGRTPFVGTTKDVLYQHRTMTPPSLASQGRLVPQPVEHVLQIALAKNPANRFGSVRLFTQALLWAMRQPMQSDRVQRQFVRQYIAPPLQRQDIASHEMPHTERTLCSQPVTQASIRTGRRQFRTIKRQQTPASHY